MELLEKQRRDWEATQIEQRKKWELSQEEERQKWVKLQEDDRRRFETALHQEATGVQKKMWWTNLAALAIAALAIIFARAA